MAKGKKKRRRGGGKSISRTVFKWLRVGSLLAPGAACFLEPGRDMRYKAIAALQLYTGYNLFTGTWSAEPLAKGWAPFIVTSILTAIVPKITSIIRRI